MAHYCSTQQIETVPCIRSYTSIPLLGKTSIKKIFGHNSNAQELWQLSSVAENAGNYSEAIRLKKVMAEQDKGTEWYLDDIADIARCYSYTTETDSTIQYSEYAVVLAEKLINTSDSIAEEYIQSAA